MDEQMPPEKSETITIRLPAELKRQIEAAAQAEKRSTSSFIEVALEKSLIASGYILEDIHPERHYNCRGRWLTIRQMRNPFPGIGHANLFVETPNEPGLIFGARDMDSLLVIAQAVFDGVDYGRQNPNSVDYSPVKEE